MCVFSPQLFIARNVINCIEVYSNFTSTFVLLWLIVCVIVSDNSQQTKRDYEIAVLLIQIDCNESKLVLEETVGIKDYVHMYIIYECVYSINEHMLLWLCKQNIFK